MSAPAIVCGLGLVGSRVVAYLRTAGVPVVAVDGNVREDDPRFIGCRVIRGDFRDPAILEQAGIREARGILILTSDDLVNVSVALLIRKLRPDVRIVLRMYNQNLLTRLGKAVSNTFALSVSALAAPVLALTARRGQVLGSFSLGQVHRQIADVTVTPSSVFANRPLSESTNGGRFVFLAHTPSEGSSRLLLNVDLKQTVQVGDRLVVCGDPDLVGATLDPISQGMGEVRWAGRLRRWWRTVRSGLGQMDLALAICTGVMFATLAISTLIYHFGLGQSLADGLYHTISVMSTGADMGGENYQGWGKVFVGTLRILGTALIAAFTAIFTNALLRARFAGALEERRIPEGGHFVVCGLGNVGYRVVEELHKANEQVVVIDQKSDNALLSMCRSRGIPVVIGDATMVESLRQARTDTARAVITCTENDLANIEIALLVTETNPTQRVVVRLGDSTLAETLREAANVRLALSVPDIAAPAFVAALFGDRVQVLFQVGGQMLTILEVVVSKDEGHLVGRTLQSLEKEDAFVPLGVLGQMDSVHQAGDSYRLRIGDRLVLAAKVNDVERLFRQ